MTKSNDMIYVRREVRKMGNLIKINMYVERKKAKSELINIKNIEENILNYNDWLEKNHREDKIENYERFLQAQ
jgi:hypothetical protein